MLRAVLVVFTLIAVAHGKRLKVLAKEMEIEGPMKDEKQKPEEPPSASGDPYIGEGAFGKVHLSDVWDLVHLPLSKDERYGYGNVPQLTKRKRWLWKQPYKKMNFFFVNVVTGVVRSVSEMWHSQKGKAQRVVAIRLFHFTFKPEEFQRFNLNYGSIAWLDTATWAGQKGINPWKYGDHLVVEYMLVDIKHLIFLSRYPHPTSYYAQCKREKLCRPLSLGTLPGEPVDDTPRQQKLRKAALEYARKKSTENKTEEFFQHFSANQSTWQFDLMKFGIMMDYSYENTEALWISAPVYPSDPSPTSEAFHKVRGYSFVLDGSQKTIRSFTQANMTELSEFRSIGENGISEFPKWTEVYSGGLTKGVRASNLMKTIFANMKPDDKCKEVERFFQHVRDFSFATSKDLGFQRPVDVQEKIC